MATVNRRYQYKGPWPADLRNDTDPGMTFTAPGFVITFDVTFDDAVADIAAVDGCMKRYGCFVEPVSTTGLAPTPYIGIVNGADIWALSVSALGVIITTKVTP